MPCLPSSFLTYSISRLGRYSQAGALVSTQPRWPKRWPSERECVVPGIAVLFNSVVPVKTDEVLGRLPSKQYAQGSRVDQLH
jgi:hypothetical protein